MANNIRTLRRAANMSQDQLAEVLKVTQGAVYQWEAGLTMPHASKLPAIADALHCSIEDILKPERRNRRGKETRQPSRRTTRR